MNGIDRNDLDEAISETFKGLKTAITYYNEKQMQVYSLTLRALVELRQQVVAEAER
jgi:Cystatin domain